MLKIILPLIAINASTYLVTPACAQPPLVSGHYAVNNRDLFVDQNGDGDNVRFHVFSTVDSCTGTFELNFTYALPPKYDGSPTNWTNASCSGIVQCPAYIGRCVGNQAPLQGRFKQINRNQIVANFGGNDITFSRLRFFDVPAISTSAPKRISSYRLQKDGSFIVTRVAFPKAK
jgi:hypothetical protein